VHPRTAIPIGAIGGALYCFTSEFVQMLRIDDPVEAFAVHGAGGIWGVLAAVLFDINMFDSSTGDTLFGSGKSFDATMKAHLVGIATIVAWSGLLSFIMFWAIRNMGLLRIDEHHEEMGLDVAEFSPKNAYSAATIVPQPQEVDDLDVKTQDRSPKNSNGGAPSPQNGGSHANGAKSIAIGEAVEPVAPGPAIVEPVSPVFSDAEDV
jgi:hypothetical protein